MDLDFPCWTLQFDVHVTIALCLKLNRSKYLPLTVFPKLARCHEERKSSLFLESMLVTLRHVFYIVP